MMRAQTLAQASPAVASSSAMCGSIQSRKIISASNAGKREQKKDRNQGQDQRQQQADIGFAVLRHLLKQPR